MCNVLAIEESLIDSCLLQFKGSGCSLAQFAPAAAKLPDWQRVRMISELLDAVNFLHGRGSAHLGLDAQVVRIEDLGVEGPRLNVIGLGAAVRLGASSGRSTYQMANAVDFHAPELLSSAILSSNLRALFLLDSWAVGVLVTIICGSLDASPFVSEADWTKGALTVEQATRRKIDDVEGDYASFLMELDSRSSGFLFRHGWVIRLILGLLTRDPVQRLTVHAAWRIAADATAAANGEAVWLPGAEASTQSRDKMSVQDIGASSSERDSQTAGAATVTKRTVESTTDTSITVNSSANSRATTYANDFAEAETNASGSSSRITDSTSAGALTSASDADAKDGAGREEPTPGRGRTLRQSGRSSTGTPSQPSELDRFRKVGCTALRSACPPDSSS